MTDIEACVSRIGPPDPAAIQKAQSRLDNLAIPRGSLGRLMELGRAVAGIRQDPMPAITKKAICTFAADHGITEEGVSAFPREVTRQMVFNFMRGGAGINVLAAHAGAEIMVVDIGVDYDFPDMPGLIKKKIARGTKNFAREPAMTRQETLDAIRVGIELAVDCARSGVDIVGTGDMGIGNTTPSSALIAAFAGLSAAEVTSRGTGIHDGVLEKKIAVIDSALQKHMPRPEDPIDVLSKVGGLEIAGICGFVLGAASENIPVVIDGFISTAGALVAWEMCPAVGDYMIAAHLSVEKGHTVMLDRMGLKPLLDLDMRLGEGTGAALGMFMAEAGVKVLTRMLTFDEAGVAEGECD